MDTDTARMTERLEVRVDPERWQRFKTLCDDRGVTISASVREAIDDLYDRYQRGELQ